MCVCVLVGIRKKCLERTFISAVEFFIQKKKRIFEVYSMDNWPTFSENIFRLSFKNLTCLIALVDNEFEM